MGNPMFMNGKVNFDVAIEAYARDHDMRVRDVVSFLAKRPSVQVAVELLGLEYEGSSILDQFAEYLDKHGYMVPKLVGDLTSQERGTTDMTEIMMQANSRPTKPGPTKEAYIQLRLQGIKRTHAFQRLGINASKGYELLKQWEIQDKDVEEALLAEEMQKKPEPTGVVPPKVDTIKAPQFAANESKREIKIPMTLSIALEEKIMRQVLAALMEEAYQTAVGNGWHETPNPLPICIVNIHGELSEAIQADRKREGEERVAEELADVILRTFDTAIEHRLDVVGALFRKMAKNRDREYRHGGLKY